MTHGVSRNDVELFLKELAKLVVPEYVTGSFVAIQNALQKMNYTTEKLMYEVMQPCRQMLERCSWLGTLVPCETLFQVATSAEGFCCSFNYRAPLDPKKV